MANVSIANLTSGASNTDATEQSTAEITATSGRVLLASITAEKATDVATPTLTALLGGSVVATISKGFDSEATPTRKTTLFLVAGASGTGVVTFDFGGATHRGFAWSVDEATNADTTTPDVVANRQTAADDTADTDFIEGITFGAFSSAENRPYVVAGGNANRTITPDGASGWLTLGEAASTATACKHYTMWGDGSDTTPTATADGSLESGIIAVEIAAAVAGGGTILPQMMQHYYGGPA